jgi:hypothetical protein
MQYPQELYSPSHPNGINFTIVAKKQTADKFGLEAADPGFIESGQVGPPTLSQQNNHIRQTMGNRANPGAYETAVAQGGLAAGAVAGFSAHNASSGTGVSGMARAGATALGGALGMGAGAALANGSGESVKLAGSISLFVPQSIVTGYSANWDEVDLGPIAGKIGSTGGSITDLLSAGGETAELIGRGAIAAAAQIPAAVGVGDFNAGDLFEATSKKVGNPYKEQLFKSMGFRQFSFTYTFSPKTAGEAASVKEIIKQFKANMHPDVSPDGMFLIYPSEFIIEFAYMGGANPNLPIVSNCALKNVKVTYGPDGMMNTFQGSGGMPSETTMELQFVELVTLTRDMVEAGF